MQDHQKDRRNDDEARALSNGSITLNKQDLETPIGKNILHHHDVRRWLVLDVLALVVGILGGFSAILLQWCIAWFKTLFFSFILPAISLRIGGFNLGYIILPIIGAAIVSPVLTRYAASLKGGGVGSIMESVAYQRAEIAPRTWPLKLLGSAITIGSGGSGGPEGPTIQMGASIGAMLGQWFHLMPNEKRVLIVCGVGAGIGSFFNAPLGGTIFAIELLLPSFEFATTIPAFIAGVAGGAIGNWLSQPEFLLKSITYPAGYSLGEYGFLAVFGLVLGALGFLWCKFYFKAQKKFARLKVHPALKPVVGALVTGCIIMLIPSLGIAGSGADGVNFVLSNQLFFLLLLGLGLLKMVTTAATVGSGGSAGLLAPSFYIGCMLGGGFVGFFNFLVPGAIDNVVIYYMLGMGAFFTAASQEPIGILILLTEMSGTLATLLPLMVVITPAFIISALLSKGLSIYTTGQELKNRPIHGDTEMILLESTVCEYVVKDLKQLSPGMNAFEASTIFKSQSYPVLPVLEVDRIVGIISVSDLNKGSAEDGTMANVDALMQTTFPSVPSCTKLQEALDMTIEKDSNWLVVVDPGKSDLFLGLFLKDIFFQIVHAKPVFY
ncbi:MAG TPA: chloride channel protein [Candidatus Lokiarchaeia archaeon]|nr:chloride channel protein [Candidatus Lokiarchaeia archaeon]